MYYIYSHTHMNWIRPEEFQININWAFIQNILCVMCPPRHGAYQHSIAKGRPAKYEKYNNVKPKSSPKSKSQIQSPEERDWDWGWYYNPTGHHPTHP